MHRGVYRILGSALTWQQGIMAACLAAGQGAVASHRSAAVLWSIPGMEPRVELTVPERRRVVLAGVTLHRASVLPSFDRRRVEAIPVTSPARTLIDLAAVLDRDRLENALDHCLAGRALTIRQLARRLEALGRNGRKGAGLLAALLANRPPEGRAPQSQFEVGLLRLLRKQKIPAPSCQHAVRLPSGRTVYIDFAYPDHHLAIEADSYRYHSSLTDWSRDRTRNSALVALGWRILHVTYQDLERRPEVVADQVVRSLLATEDRKI
jgi:very-short-patch-repair endonuclease